jgi:hypothetical protein
MTSNVWAGVERNFQDKVVGFGAAELHKLTIVVIKICENALKKLLLFWKLPLRIGSVSVVIH